ncbi:hypothetical protein F511_29785 [Dorcoceras hygrometricum]|uniref:Uncharacterized protein n=1 Tax=Dorcoceras hygrometricum TaxID=472368 RepID=A0A2Z7CJH9_9LAMI|nr:hypothetical protein F511_29785 [Dorcoceras hygrometricum]
MSTGYTVARDWVYCSLLLVEQVKICLQLVVQSLVVKCLRLDFPTTASAPFLDTQTVDSFYNSSNSFCNRYDDVTVAATSFFNRYDDVMVAESRFLSISNADTLGVAPSAPRTRATAALRMKQIALDNQDRTIRRLRAQLATERRGLAATKKELKEMQVALEASHKVITGLTEIGLSMSKKIEKMKVKKQLVKANHVECHQKFQARIHEAEDSMQAQHLLIEALVDENDSLLSHKVITGLTEIGLSMSKKIEKMKVKKQHVKANHVDVPPKVPGSYPRSRRLDASSTLAHRGPSG